MWRRLLLGLGVLAASGWASVAAPLEAYGKLPSIEQAVVSPSGAFIAYVVTNGDERRIAIQKVDGELTLVVPAGFQKVRNLVWGGDEHLIVTTSTAKQAAFVDGARTEQYVAQDVNLTTKHARPLLAEVHTADDTMNTILGGPEVRLVGGKPIAFVHGWHFVGTEGHVALFRVDLGTGIATIVDPGSEVSYDWVVDPQGQPVARAEYSDERGVWRLMVRTPSTTWRTAQVVSAPIDTPDLVGLGRDGKSILVETPEEAGDTWRELSPETGAWGQTATVAPDQAIRDPASGRLIGESTLVGDNPTTTFYDPRDEAVWKAILKAFPNDMVSLASWSDDRKKIVVRVDSAELGPAYALVDVTTLQAKWLGDEYEGVKEHDISPVTPIRYKAADGTGISGYLTLPRGRPAHGLPLAVLVHGGPAARDIPGFDWWAQALASRGYAVLQANYRGSDGLGLKFMQAGFGEWGRKMRTDLSDGVRDLVRQGIVDPKRVCIIGASYGGYAALAGAAIDHGVYRCAVSVAGVADVHDLIFDFRNKHGRSVERYWERYIGVKDLNDPTVAKISPVAHAADVDIPVLLIHGRDDTVVPISHSQRMAAALRAAGKPVEFIELAGEDHWLSSGRTRLEMLQASVAFLGKHNPAN